MGSDNHDIGARFKPIRTGVDPLGSDTGLPAIKPGCSSGSRAVTGAAFPSGIDGSGSCVGRPILVILMLLFAATLDKS